MLVTFQNGTQIENKRKGEKRNVKMACKVPMEKHPKPHAGKESFQRSVNGG